VAFDLSPPETQPLYDVISHLVYSAGREQVSDAWVAGQRVVEGRQVLASSAQPDLMPNVGAWQNRCRQVLLTAGAS
jgi:5-methylthioadenosine/S-adenosylhomocysteine deaminase